MTDAAGASPPRRRWLIVALTVSLAFNLFLVGVFAGHVHRHPHLPPSSLHERLQHIAEGLSLNDAQKTAFAQLELTMRQHGAQMRRSNVAAWAKIGDPATPSGEIGDLLGGTVKNRTAFQQEVADAFGKFLATLTPEQRASFVDEMRLPGRHHMRH
jgi:uncharacterized membrane protein